MNTLLRAAVTFIAILDSALAFGAPQQTSAELQKALVAAERARATPKGEAYQEAFNGSLREMMMAGLRDCLPINAPGVRKPPGFRCVLIIGKTGKPRWIIRGSRDAMAQCFYAKLVTLTYPPPPADNWPVMFGINMPRP